jgi:hypothetical protein
MRSGELQLELGTPSPDSLVARYSSEIMQACPEGPVVVGGNCQGAIIALAVTRRLIDEGRDVRLFAAADTVFADLFGSAPLPVCVALFPAVYGKFSPYRRFRHPEYGLRQFAPRGLRMIKLTSSYGRIMFGPALQELNQALAETIEWAGKQPAPEKTEPVPNAGEFYRRHLSARSSIAEVVAGERASLAIKVKNTGSVAWKPFAESGLMLGNHWLSSCGDIAVWSDGRAPLKRRLEPGRRAFMTLEVVAPSQPGAYVLEIDLVHEGIRWFGDVTDTPLHIPVCVRPADNSTISLSSRRKSVTSRFMSLRNMTSQLIEKSKGK